jgi:hypothetical protein
MADAIIIITEKSWIVCPIVISVIIISNYFMNKEYNNQRKFLNSIISNMNIPLKYRQICSNMLIVV